MKIFLSFAVSSLYILLGMDLDSISCLACNFCGGNIILLYLFNECSFIDLQINIRRAQVKVGLRLERRYSQR